MKTDAERIDFLEERVSQLENEIEKLFYSLVNERNRQKTMPTIVELACCEHFEVNRRQFHLVDLGIYGDVSTVPPEIRRLAHARKWHMSIMTHIMCETSYSLKKNYRFYNFKKVKEHEPSYMGALNAVTEKDRVNRDHLYEIGLIMKRLCEEEGLLDDRLEFFELK